MNRTIAALAIALTPFAAACGGSVSPDELQEALIEQGLPEALATCITDELAEVLTEDEFSEVAKADDNLSGISPDVEAKVEDAVETCALAS